MTANTCANAITFPVNNIYMEYELFKNEMISCIQDCQGLEWCKGVVVSINLQN